MFDFIKRLFAKGPKPSQVASTGVTCPESEVVITSDSDEVRCVKPGGVVERIKWTDLDAVLIETNDQGPFGPDVFWLLLTKSMESGCVFPSGATGEGELLEELQNRLPEFSNEAVIAAMGSLENNRFLVWERKT